MAREDDQHGTSSAPDRSGADADEHVVSDEHGTRTTGPAAASAGSLGKGRANAPDTAGGGRGGQQNGAETGSHIARGGGNSGPQVLANGGTRADGGAAGTAGTHSAGDTAGEDDTLALARQAGEKAMDHSPSSTGGTLQRPRGPSRDATVAGSSAGIEPSMSSPPAGTTPKKSEGRPMENHDQGSPVHPDESSGSSMAAAANDADRARTEAATNARSGGGSPIGGSSPPSGAPPAPITPDPYGGTNSESHADPGFPPPVPERPTPGLTREPGPEAQT